MNKVKLNDIIKDGNIVIPMYMLRSYKKYNLKLDEFIFLMYLYNKKFVVFDPELIANELNYDLMEVMGYVSLLQDKGIITLEVSKENGIIEEKISLNNFYEKISMSLINEFNDVSKIDDNIYVEIEREFNRKLTPMEREVVKEWQDNDISSELMHEALKEASLNGVANLRYIDRILIEWHNKGITKKNEIKEEIKKEDMEIFNCNWLDDEEEL